MVPPAVLPVVLPVDGFEFPVDCWNLPKLSFRGVTTDVGVEMK